VVTIEGIAVEAHRIMVERPVRVRRLQVHPQTGYELQRQMMIDACAPHDYRPPGLYEPGPVGLDLETNEHLPPGVWRLADEHGTLLYDCREGETVP
jgi:hypothetical protein